MGYFSILYFINHPKEAVEHPENNEKNSKGIFFIRYFFRNSRERVQYSAESFIII
jgi:hypothetical protein